MMHRTWKAPWTLFHVTELWRRIQWIARRGKNNIELISIHPSLLGQRGFVSVDLRPAEYTELNHNELFKRVGKMEASRSNESIVIMILLIKSCSGGWELLYMLMVVYKSLSYSPFHEHDPLLVISNVMFKTKHLLQLQTKTLHSWEGYGMLFFVGVFPGFFVSPSCCSLTSDRPARRLFGSSWSTWPLTF